MFSTFICGVIVNKIIIINPAKDSFFSYYDKNLNIIKVYEEMGHQGRKLCQVYRGVTCSNVQ